MSFQNGTVRNPPAGSGKSDIPGLILPLTRIFAWVKAEGLDNLRAIEPPVIFASNHQSHLDVPAILCALPPHWRYRVAPAMAKEFFDAHFHPHQLPVAQAFYERPELLPCATRVLSVSSAATGSGRARSPARCRRPGVGRQLYPDLPRKGKRTDAGEILPFQPGVGMLAARLRVPVVPVRIVGLERVLHKSAGFPTPGRVRVKFGPPQRFEGDDYAALAKQIEDAVSKL